MLVGYARMSPSERETGLTRQQRDLGLAGCEKVYTDHVSSVAQRDQLRQCLAHLCFGDALVATKPDRLARSTFELLSIEADLTKRGIGLVVLSMGGELLDTRSPTSKLMLTILAAVAAWERELLLERQCEAIAKAKADGRCRGRAPTAMRQAGEIAHLRASGVSAAEIATRLGLSRMSVYRVIKKSKGSAELALQSGRVHR